MRFRNQQQNSSVPEVNLVPMMDVMMSVLTFFIITSMALTGQRLANINLPGTGGAGVREQTAPKTLVVGLNQQREILIDGQVVNTVQLAEKMEAYLLDNPEGVVILKADRELPYEEVVKLLKEMSNIGGSQVSLAIERR
ncbi:MAG: biopolymer transporter ExbD [Coleofasciculus sp. S288]|nr:biopolymer transporter ExbD [Coleofasciculus sp. S288]